MAVPGTFVGGARKSRSTRIPFLVLGFFCVALGYVGILLPVMPSTVFFICAAWAFKRSSPRFENWLMNHRMFGKTLRDWDERQAISSRTKVVAIAGLLTCVGVSIWLIEAQWVRASLAGMAICVALFIGTRKNAD